MLNSRLVKFWKSFQWALIGQEIIVKLKKDNTSYILQENQMIQVNNDNVSVIND